MTTHCFIYFQMFVMILNCISFQKILNFFNMDFQESDHVHENPQNLHLKERRKVYKNRKIGKNSWTYTGFGMGGGEFSNNF